MTQHRHASELDLLRYADGELSWFGRLRLARHIRTCWQCRTQLASTHETIGAFVRYREKLWLPSVPAAPVPWADLRNAMRQRRAEHEMSKAGAGRSLRLLAAGAAVAAVAGAFAVITMRWQERRIPPAAAPRPLSAPALPLPSTAPPAAPPRVPAPPPPLRPSAAAPDRDVEVRIVAALHRVGGDLGEPIEIRRQGAAWQVVVTGLSARRQAELVEALRREAGVPLITEPQATPPAGLPASQRPPVVERSAADDLTTRLGGRTRLEKLSNEVLEQSDAVMARVFALRNLDRRFPAGTEAGLSSDSRAMLAAIRQSHRAGFNLESQRLEERAAPLLEAFGLAVSPAPPPADLFAAAQQVDVTINALLADPGGRPSPRGLALELARGLGALRAARER